MKRLLPFAFLVLLTAFSVMGFLREDAPEEPVTVTYEEPAAHQGEMGIIIPPYTFVIDPGHGGEDGGAISVTGLNESGMNLSIGLKMGAFMRFLGLSPEMTREEDISRHDESAVSLYEKKRSDLANRAKMVNAIPDSILVSVHQNYFEQSGVKGLETYYNANPQSKALAVCAQNLLNSAIPQTGSRTIKEMSSNYLLGNVTGPAILVECGFISNPEDEARLTARDYQLKLAAAITVACVNWAESGR